MQRSTAADDRASWIILAISACLLVGCATGIGPRAVRGQRGEYNAAVQQTNDEQLLLNIVRLRYAETPSFLEVTGIVTQVRFEIGGQAEGTVVTDPGATIGVSAAYSDQPTITYLPSQGEQFVRRFLTPVTPEALLLLWQSGWSFKRVARLAVQRLNRIANAPRASGPTPGRLMLSEPFATLVDVMAPLVRDGKLRFELEDLVIGGTPSRRVVLRIVDPRDPAVGEVVRLLELTPHEDHYPLLTGALHEAGGPPWGAIHVDTRSLLGILFFVANGVELPPEDVQAGVVASPVAELGAAVDWSAIVGDVLRIRSSDTEPVGAQITVSHRGRWFFIEDTDLSSKSTFVLLAQLYALQASPPATGGPTLTLPVGR